ncbi:MAG: FAD binding domain-containing protein [Candidatus Binatia bacterium]
MDYFEPESISEAISVLSKRGDSARVIAGGTDVMVDMKHEEEPACLVNIKRIPDMSYILLQRWLTRSTMPLVSESRGCL